MTDADKSDRMYEALTAALRDLDTQHSLLGLGSDEQFLVCELSNDYSDEWQATGEHYTLPHATYEMSAVIVKAFDAAWPKRAMLTVEDEEPRTLEFSAGASEQYEFRTVSRTVTPRFFAYDELGQEFYALDLRDPATDVFEAAVYTVEHDGSDFAEAGTLREFLDTLKRAA